MAGTDSMETMIRMSALQPMSQDTISILESAGSRGNSTIRRPVGVKAPERPEENTITRSKGEEKCIRREERRRDKHKTSDKLLFHQKLAGVREKPALT